MISRISPLGVWERSESSVGEGWKVPATEVDALVRAASARYQVVDADCGPVKWESYIVSWEAEFGHQLKIRASRDHPMAWWTTGGRSVLIVRALEQFHCAVVDGDLIHDGSAVLTRHVLNARRRVSRTGIQIAKEHPDSPRKIDAAVAAVLVRLDALARGIGNEPAQMGGWTF